MIFFTRRQSLNSSPVQDVAVFVSGNVLLKPPARRTFDGLTCFPFSGSSFSGGAYT